ncbi:MAG: CHASE2 domain-containing protein [Hyphomicrobium sp.]
MPISLRAINPLVLIAALILIGCVALRIVDPPPIAGLRASVFDSYLRAAPRIADPGYPVRIVAIDEASLARVGQWPWPRSKLADLVVRLASAGARTITFDIMLVETDRLSPGELARALVGEAALRPLLSEIAKLPSNDAQLGAAIRAAPVVMGVVGDQQAKRGVDKPRTGFAVAGDDPKSFVHPFPGGVANLAEVAAGAAGIGAVNWLPADDLVVRRAPLLVTIAGELFPSLALEALRVGAGQSSIFVKASGGSGVSAFGQRTGVESVRVGGTVIPTDAQGEMWLRFSPSDPKRIISAHAVLDGAVEASEVRARDILIGATAAGLLDLRATPLDTSVPGVEIHAQALEQMLSGDHLTRPAYATGAEIAFLVLAGALATWLIARSGAAVAAIVAAAAIAIIVATSQFAYSSAGVLLDPVYPSVSLALLYLGTSLTSYLRSEADRAKIRSAFSHYVAPSLVAELVRNHDKLKLGGETRNVTLLFADVRGFSRLSENMRAEDVVAFVNRLFTPLSETILSNRGTIDKFMGDAVMAFWNAPTDDPDHARNACSAALAMLESLSQLNAEIAAEAEAAGRTALPIRIGIGINTGACVVGNVGSPERFDYSVLGDAVNVASRFEEATKAFDADIIIGTATAAAAPDFAHVEIGAVTPRGKDRSECMFALLGDERLADTAEFRMLKRDHAALLAAGKGSDPTKVGAALAACLAHAPVNARALYAKLAQQLGVVAAGGV